MKLLIVKFSSIGDCVMAVPAASMFRRAFPDGTLVWAVDPRCADVLSDELVTEKFDIPWEVWKRDKVSAWARAKHYLKLRKYEFDVGVDLQGHSKTAICLRLSGAKRRLTVMPLDPLSKLLNPTARVDPSLHAVERNIAALRLMGIDHADTSPIMPRVALPSLAEPAMREKGLVSIAVSTGHPKKNLPLETWKAVAEAMVSGGYGVAFTGGPGDVAPVVPGAVDLCAKLSLRETMGVLAASRIHLAGDTGSGHICAAYGVPVVSIFGPTKPDIYRPYSPKTVVLKADDLMQGVGPDQIVAAAREVLG